MPIELTTARGNGNLQGVAPRPAGTVLTGAGAYVEIGLNAAILAVRGNEPHVLVVRQEGEARTGSDSLPFGPFSPLDHRTLEGGLRSWVQHQAGLQLGYVEQLYTFGDRGRLSQFSDADPHMISIGYLALTRYSDEQRNVQGIWRSWYDYFPWEDWRRGRPAIVADEIQPRLKEWAEQPGSSSGSTRPIRRAERVRICFGLDGAQWDEEKVLDRYELLYEAGLLEEAMRDETGEEGAWTENCPRLGTPSTLR